MDTYIWISIIHVHILWTVERMDTNSVHSTVRVELHVQVQVYR